MNQFTTTKLILYLKRKFCFDLCRIRHICDHKTIKMRGGIIANSEDDSHT